MSDGTRARRVGSVAVAAMALAAFGAVVPFAFEPVDAGMILYPSWLTARGWLPYRDFVHVYGPALFAVNGAVFHFFGPELLAVRLLLVGLKAVVALQVFWLARRVAPTAIAVGCAVVLISAWSAPLWTSVTPYAVYYELPLALGALALMLRHPARPLAAGVLCGLAATFKHTAGLFALVALVLDACVRMAGRSMMGAVRAVVLLGIVGLGVVYLGHSVATAGGLAIGMPLALTAGALAVRDRTGRQGLREVLTLAAGFAVPLGVAAGVYLIAGGAGRAAFDTVAGLPQQIVWFVPFQVPASRALLAAAIWAAVMVATGPQRSRALRAACLVGVAAAALAIDRDIRLLGGWNAYVRGRGWYGDAFSLVAWAPVLVVWLGIRPAWRSGGTGRSVFHFAAANLLQLHPAADMPHGLLLLPAVLPLAAFLAAGALAVPGWRRVARGGLLVLAGLGIVAPFADGLALRLAAPRPAKPFVRATGIGAETARAQDLGSVVERLRATTPASQPILVLTGEPLAYVLAERDSVFASDEFLLYLVALGTLPDETARELMDETAMVGRLASLRPVVVDEPGSIASSRIRRALPRLSAAIDAGYELRETVGRYRVFTWRD